MFFVGWIVDVFVLFVDDLQNEVIDFIGGGL